MTKKPILPFKDFIGKRMTSYQIGIPLGLSILISIFTASIILIQFADTNKRFIESIAPHIAVLLESQDRPEIQRFVRAVSTKQETALEVIYNDEIIASTLNASRIGKIIDWKVKQLPVLDLQIQNGKLMSFTTATNAKIVIYLDTKSIIYVSLGISIAIFVFTLLIGNWLIAKVINESQKGLTYLSELEGAIRNTQNGFEPLTISHFPISELETIRAAFIESQEKLRESNEKITKSKAREMASYAYKNLIHDLHVPVTALRNHLKIMNLERATKEDRENALTRIVDLAEQVLKQVKSAKSHLGFEVSLKNDDLVESVKRATDNAQVASFDKPKVEIKTIFPSEQIITSHDPILLGRAVSNIVANAIEAATSRVQVEMQLNNGLVSIKVSDDGKGISQEDVSLHLQGRGKSTKAERMGIGLASANHIIRSHAGKIIYQNSTLGGACFEIQLQGDIV